MVIIVPFVALSCVSPLSIVTILSSIMLSHVSAL